MADFAKPDKTPQLAVEIGLNVVVGHSTRLDHENPSGKLGRVIDDGGLVGQLHRPWKVCQRARKPPYDDVGRYVMPAQFDAIFHAIKAPLGAVQKHENEIDVIAGVFRLLHQSDRPIARKGRLDGEIPLAGKLELDGFKRTPRRRPFSVGLGTIDGKADSIWSALMNRPSGFTIS
ncbi:hypothetical protein [Rhizobium leguminosarum]|uniref:hypothetical protein n=1 Tax=Rhizobium leguminosarum TaxID=384 RepID=UPI0013BA549D|nr:hypothetical protein [Rhizobium leguminosarum]NEI66558.1 hypothetical protein [Rhizobium leguminosarum]